MNRPLALQLGDVAGVGADLRRGLEASTHWHVMEVPTSQVALDRKLMRLARLPERTVGTLVRVAAMSRRVKPNLIHLHGARWAPFVLPTSSAPLVVHAHGTDVRGQSETRTGQVVYKTLERAALVIASTPDTLVDLPDHARFLPNPVDIETFTPGPDLDPTGEGAGSDESQQTIVVFSRLSDVKGAARIVDAVARIKAVSDARIVGFSGGEFTEDAVRAGVEMLEPLDRAGIVKLLRSADVVIGQQRLRALGRSECEAMACGRPVVTDIRPDDHRGVEADAPVAPSSSASELAHSVLTLLEDPARRHELGVAGRRYVEERHALPQIASTLASWYDEVSA